MQWGAWAQFCLQYFQKVRKGIYAPGLRDQRPMRRRHRVQVVVRDDRKCDTAAGSKQPCNTAVGPSPTRLSLQIQTTSTDLSAAAVWIRKSNRLLTLQSVCRAPSTAWLWLSGSTKRSGEAAQAWRVFEAAAGKIPLMKGIEEAWHDEEIYFFSHTHKRMHTNTGTQACSRHFGKFLLIVICSFRIFHTVFQSASKVPFMRINGWPPHTVK